MYTRDQLIAEYKKVENEFIDTFTPEQKAGLYLKMIEGEQIEITWKPIHNIDREVRNILSEVYQKEEGQA